MPLAARVIIEVMAGVIPGQSLPEYTKRWAVTSKEWYGPEDGVTWKPSPEELEKELNRRADLLKERYDAAVQYSREIMDPQWVNWVRVDWMWL